MKKCKQCQKKFVVTESDNVFYKKISPTFCGKLYHIPEPTFCPDCRHQRRLAWRNDRTFYRRKCDKSGKEFISIYAPEKPDLVYHPDVWWSDAWDPLDYGRDFDFSRPFFEQYIELQRSVPKLGIHIVNCQNSYYCNYCGDDNNCYLDIAGEANEDCYFNLFTKYSKSCCDTTFTYHSTQCYETIQVYNGYNVNYSMYGDDNSDVFFGYDLKGCNNCLFSANLRQKSYHIFNQPYSPEDYKTKLTSLDFGSYQKREAARNQWFNYRQQHAIYRDAYLLNCENCSGNDLKNCHNTQYSFNATNCENSKYLFDVLDAKDCQDMNYSLYQPELAYEVMSTLQARHSAFLTGGSTYNDNMYYCDMVQSSSNLFGCVGLRHKKFCILNKQYSQADYEKLCAKIIQHMMDTKEWGEFFPATLSSWGYNETVAMEYFPLNQADAIAKQFSWFNNEPPTQSRAQTYVIPDHIQDVPESILNELLACITCGKNFRIIAQELTYYKTKHIPIPHHCPDCRHLNRIQLRTPRQLFKRTCTKCSKEIVSSYAANRPEKVYCEKCYLDEVY